MRGEFVKAMKKDVLMNRLQLYLDCEAKILSGAQSYTIGQRTLTRADLKEVRAIIDDLAAQIDALELKGGRQKRVVFMP